MSVAFETFIHLIAGGSVKIFIQFLLIVIFNISFIFSIYRIGGTIGAIVTCPLEGKLLKRFLNQSIDCTNDFYNFLP